MVQYLYATYSVRVTPERRRAAEGAEPARVDRRRGDGSPRHRAEPAPPRGRPADLGRGRASYASEIYPFYFTLEPVALGSLAKYVTVESPPELPREMTAEDRDLVAKIWRDAVTANGGTRSATSGASWSG